MVFGPGSKDHKKTIKVPMEIHIMLPLAALGRNGFVLHVLEHHRIGQDMLERVGALHNLLCIAWLQLVLLLEVNLIHEGAVANQLELPALRLSLRDGVVDDNFERFRQLALIQTQR